MVYFAVALATCLPLCAASIPSARRNVVWGLDLGNENMVMAVAHRNGVDVVTNDVSGRQTPSAIYFAGDHRLIGEHSIGRAGSNPIRLIDNIKYLLRDRGLTTLDEILPTESERLLGTASHTADEQPPARRREVSSSLTQPSPTVEPPVFYETRPTDDSDRTGRLAVVRHLGEEIELSASEAIAYLLVHCAGIVARDAGESAGARDDEEDLGAALSPSSRLVTSVPSYFTLRQRKAILDAARIAGVSMPMVIDQGTAVALAYGMLKGGLSAAGVNVAFVDIGHSCTQVTIAEFIAGGLKVLGRGCVSGGGTATGEASIYDRVCAAVSEQGLAVKGSARAEFRLAKAIGSAMKTLSANMEARLSVECIDGDRDFSMTLTREEVETACAAVADGVSSACHEALGEAGIGVDKVADVELLGGGSYVPLLRRAVEGVFGEERVRRTMSSSESVARGCALAAAQHSSVFKLRPFRITDCLPRNLRLVWCYRPPSPDATNGSDDDDDGSGDDDRSDQVAAYQETGELTGEVDVPAGTPIPWSTPVYVDTGGAEHGVVHVHLMEGADRLASYKIDLSGARSLDANRVGARGGGAPQAAAMDARVSFSLRVDVAGVPTVDSAMLQFKEQVTEFVEVPAPAPKPSASASASAPNTDAQATGTDKSMGREGQESSDGCGTADPGQAADDGHEITRSEPSGEQNGEREATKKDDLADEDVEFDGKRRVGKEDDTVRLGEADTQSSPPGPADTADSDVRETPIPIVEGAEESAGTSNGEDGSCSRDSRGETAKSKDSTESEESTKPTKPTKSAEPSKPSEPKQKQQQQQQQPPQPRRVKVPRLVMRTRGTPLRIQQTYTGMLEGAALEEARARERDLRAQDLAVRQAGEARNSLEDLVYASRASLEPRSGRLSAFAKPNEASAILATLEETEEWLYGADQIKDKRAFDSRASSIREQLSELEHRRDARLRLVAALDEVGEAVDDGDRQIAARQDSMSASQKKHAENELTSTRRFLADARRKLDGASRAGPGGAALDYGSLTTRLPMQEGDPRKKLEQLHKALASLAHHKEHSTVS